jgi:putative ABC transport system substrate-binding protein
VIGRALAFAFLIGAGIGAAAQTADRVVRLGFVDPNAQSSSIYSTEAFWQRLHDLGWVQGTNLIVVYRSAEGRPDLLPALMTDVLNNKIDVLVTSSTPGALAAKKATSTVPIVVLAMGDPIGMGLAGSLAHPGGNLTGFSIETTEEVTGKFLEFVQETVPRVSTLAVISNPDNPLNRRMIGHLKAAAAARRLNLRFFDVRAPQDFIPAFSAARQVAQAALVLTDPLTVTHRKTITELAARYRIPAMYTLLEFTREGGLIAYGTDQTGNFRRAAEYVDRILRGANPGDLPIEQPMQLRLVVNLGAAKAIGLTIPQSILVRADEVIR